MTKDIRWRQRFENLEKAYPLLERTVAIAQPSEAERGGLIRFFETTFELTWKTLKDYLEGEGFAVTSPRDTLKQAFAQGLLNDGALWMEMLDDRNLTAHTYDDATSKKVEQLIKEKYSSLSCGLSDAAYQNMNVTPRFGLPPHELALIHRACQEFSTIEEVVIFGSRAMGNFKPGSDVDLAVKGPADHMIAHRLSAQLNEHLPLPYMFDVVDYATITHAALREHIDQYGKVLYRSHSALP